MTASSTASPQPLMARFDQRSGEMMVYGGGFFGVFVLSVAIGRGDVALGVVALMLFAVAFHFWPFIRRNEPALIASSAGLEVTGLGVIAWDGIKDAVLIDKAMRTIRNSELHLTLGRPLEAALSVDKRGDLARRLMVQIWRHKDDTLVVKLEPLDMPPEPILETVQGFLHRL